MVASKVLRKEKALAPKLRFKEFAGNWQMKRLGELLEFKNGINAGKEQYGYGIKFINVLDILNSDYITYDSIIGSVDVDENVASNYPVNYGDILFQRSSETRDEVGSACVYLDRDKTAIFGGFVIRGRKIGEYDPVFLNKLLKTDVSRNEITSKSGGSTRYNVGQETLSSVALSFPSLSEQQKIASFLSAVDEKMQQLNRKKQLLEQYKKGLMQQLFSGKLRFKDECGKAFHKWQEKRLVEIVATPISDGPHTTPRFISNGIPFLSVNNLVENKIDFSNVRQISKEDHELFSKKCKPQKGDVLLGKAASVGKVAIVETDTDFNIWSPIAMIRLKNDISPKFIYYSFQTSFLIKQIERLTNSSSQGNIGMGDIGKLKFAVPSEQKEQTKIANYLSNIDNKIESLIKQITETQTFKKGLLQQMFV